MPAEVFIKPVEGSLRDAIRACFDQFGGVDALTRGNVFIKINCTFPKKGAITDPAVIVAAVEVIRENPAVENIYVMDNAAAGSFTRVTFLVEKLGKRVKKAGGTPLYLDEQKPIDYDLKGQVLGKIPLPEILVENLIKNKTENTYINIPKLKVHGQLGVTIGIKNQYGLQYDQQKLYSHHLLHQKLTDLLAVFKPDFTLVDAVEVCDYGAIPFLPEWCIPMDLLVAGQDPVAVDTVGSALIGLEMPLVKYIQMAAERGFGCGNLNEIKITPSKAILDEHRIQLHRENASIRAEDIHIVRGTEKSCYEGCYGLSEYLQQLLYGAKHTHCLLVAGKNHQDNMELLDNATGPFIVIGPCAITELKEYFDHRSETEDLKVFYVEDHFDPIGIIPAIRKAANVSLSALTKHMDVGIFRLLLSYLNAKLHGVNCKFM
jgi:uncharacterized protein (DUF362 family)